MKCESFFLGTCDYVTSLHLQNEFVSEVRGKKLIKLLGLEYDAVITLGKRGDATSDLKSLNPEFSVHHVDRGGQATLHNTGQLVIYPICDLRHNEKGVREFILSLNEATVSLLSRYGIQSHYEESQGGVFTSRGKISFTGLRIREGVSTHGIALNVKNDLRDFQQIVACGVAQARLDSMASCIEKGSPSNLNIKTAHMCSGGEFALSEIFSEWCSIWAENQ